ncbi:site-specific integrase [Aquincola sp. S2]|uniref:Site-specific integrase n=2 Tax=Pseudaquabacterium terrae TaxID=2732868 RepID=A0ABX2EM95_9BURK|nr:site-specific integrase [Aquabacterium terrae]NRF69700.1 site-specific integrase [Aquabacterium terrae]
MKVAAVVQATWRSFFRELDRLDIAAIVHGSPRLLGEGLLPLKDAAEALGTDPLLLATELAINHGNALYAYALHWEGWDPSQVLPGHQINREDTGGYVLDSVADLCELTSVSGYVQFLEPDFVAETLRQGKRIGSGRISTEVHALFLIRPGGIDIGTDDLWVAKSHVETFRLATLSTLSKELIEKARATAKDAAQRPEPVRRENGSEHRHAAKPVSSIIREFVRMKSRPKGAESKPAWSATVIRQGENRLKWFVPLVGDRLSGELCLMPEGEDIVDEYAQRLRQLPTGPDLSKMCRDLGHELTWPKIEQWISSNPCAVCMSIDTVHTYVSKLGECFRWAMSKTYMTANPAATFASGRPEKTEKDEDERDLFSQEDLALIFSSEWYAKGRVVNTRGVLSRHFRSFYYWLPLLGIYAGGRLNELSQLYLDDLKLDEKGNVYIHFSLDRADKLDLDPADEEPDVEGAEKRLKTVNAQRDVPIHPHLVELGLLGYAAALRAAGHERLFPELRFDADKGYGKDAGKWFNDRFLGDQLGIPRNGKKVFHSLRHAFANALEETGTTGRRKYELLGHKRGKQHADVRYSKDVKGAGLLSRVSLLNFSLPAIAPFDVRAGLRAVEIAASIKERNARSA